jgi:hypothetical protein
MPYNYHYQATCGGCGTTKAGNAAAMQDAGWKMLAVNSPTDIVVMDSWDHPMGAECACPDCYAKYQELQATADAAQQAAYDALGKFTPTPSPSGGSGTEDDPYTWEAGVTCVLNAFYTHDSKLYVYMPSDATAKAYDSWEDAVADMAAWDSDTETTEG